MKPFSLAHKIACYLKQKHGLADLNLLDLRDIIEQHEQDAIAAAVEAIGAHEDIESTPNTTETQTFNLAPYNALKMSMKREFYHYKEWEDYKAGMYRNVKKESVLDYIDKARKLLIDSYMLQVAMARVIEEWPVSTAQNLSNNENNCKAWLGQAACCIHAKVPEDLTRAAWNTLNQAQMNLANKVAENIISLWKETKNQNGIQKNLFEHQCA